MYLPYPLRYNQAWHSLSIKKGTFLPRLLILGVLSPVLIFCSSYIRSLWNWHSTISWHHCIAKALIKTALQHEFVTRYNVTPSHCKALIQTALQHKFVTRYIVMLSHCKSSNFWFRQLCVQIRDSDIFEPKAIKCSIPRLIMRTWNLPFKFL